MGPVFDYLLRHPLVELNVSLSNPVIRVQANAQVHWPTPSICCWPIRRGLEMSQEALTDNAEIHRTQMTGLAQTATVVLPRVSGG